MPTTEANPPLTTARCPLCDALLDPQNPDACTKCDWVGPGHPGHLKSGSVRDKIAVCLSVVPGLGHIYKGDKGTGVMFFVGSVIVFAFCSLAAAASALWGFLLLPLYWVGVMLHVYWAEDKGLAPRAKR